MHSSPLASKKLMNPKGVSLIPFLSYSLSILTLLSFFSLSLSLPLSLSLSFSLFLSFLSLLCLHILLVKVPENEDKTAISRGNGNLAASLGFWTPTNNLQIRGEKGREPIKCLDFFKANSFERQN